MVKLDPQARRVIVGPKEALLTAALHLKDLNWLAAGAFEAERAISVKIRNTQEPVAAKLVPQAGNRAEVVFAAPEGGASPGQACVFYDGETVLGGGWIESTRAMMPMITEAAE